MPPGHGKERQDGEKSERTSRPRTAAGAVGPAVRLERRAPGPQEWLVAARSWRPSSSSRRWPGSASSRCRRRRRPPPLPPEQRLLAVQPLRRQAAEPGRTPVLGDSVVWGEYVTPHQTLTAYLNRQAGGRAVRQPRPRRHATRWRWRAWWSITAAPSAAAASSSTATSSGWPRRGTTCATRRSPLNHPALLPQFGPESRPTTRPSRGGSASPWRAASRSCSGPTT